MKIQHSSLSALIVLSLATPITMAGQNLTEAEVPPAVISAFKSAHPKATQVEYEKESEDGTLRYEVEFREDGKKIEIDYAADGAILKTEQDD